MLLWYSGQRLSSNEMEISHFHMSKALDDIESDFWPYIKECVFKLFDSPMVVELEVDPNLNHAISGQFTLLMAHESFDTLFGIASIHITYDDDTSGDRRSSESDEKGVAISHETID
ncbi:uncharacterized protein G2W53_003272 [Senna tora]|uniref:Uncharacterized protein n=1 Tax=Senna tora TaxID=362788 RepID=A0A835CG62_9FABA|nr:uncharacterized protein G2W53_003272 [Senna tora]